LKIVYLLILLNSTNKIESGSLSVQHTMIFF